MATATRAVLLCVPCQTQLVRACTTCWIANTRAAFPDKNADSCRWLVVRISEANSQRHLRFIVPVILLLAGFIWASRPVADGILFARHVPQLILPVQAQADDKAANGGHSALAFATSQRQLSAFLSGNAARVLAIQQFSCQHSKASRHDPQSGQGNAHQVGQYPPRCYQAKMLGGKGQGCQTGQH